MTVRLSTTKLFSTGAEQDDRCHMTVGQSDVDDRANFRPRAERGRILSYDSMTVHFPGAFSRALIPFDFRLSTFTCKSLAKLVGLVTLAGCTKLPDVVAIIRSSWPASF